MANGRCRLHGGLTPGGPASPHWVSGKHSKYLPARMKERYSEALGDQELLELRSDIALLDARLADVLGRVDTGESGRLWRQLAEWRREALQARAAGDDDRMSLALNSILDLIQRGQADYAAWDDVTNLVERRRRLVESERKRLVELRQVITNERAVALMAAIFGVVSSVVTDRQQLGKIADGLERLLTTSDAGT